MPRVTSDTSANASGSARGVHTGGAGVHTPIARPLLVKSALVLTVLAATPAAAPAREPAAAPARPDDVEACATASEEGQELRDKGRLRAARALFVECAAQRCPAIVRKDCAAWMAQVEERLPTVAIHARDAQGRDVSDVRVSVDGEALADGLDGRALAVDPGSRTFRFARAGAPEVVLPLLLREGEKGRLVDVVLGAPPPAAKEPREAPSSIPTAAWALGGVSLAGFGAGIGFGVVAKTAVDDMRAPGGCAPACDPARVDGARRDMILANVLIGVGAAALVSAAVVTLVEVRARPEGKAAAWHIGAGAGPGGVQLSGSF